MISVCTMTNRALFLADTHQILKFLLATVIKKLTSVLTLLLLCLDFLFGFFLKKYLYFMWVVLDLRLNFVLLLFLRQMHSSFFPVYSPECWVQENCILNKCV